METKFSVSLDKIISELELDVAYMPNEPKKILNENPLTN